MPRKAATDPTKPAAPQAPASQHPLFDTLVRVLEGRLTDLIGVEPGPDGTPLFTLRVILADETKTDPKPAK